ncbi:hypothetical protein [Mesorhizobium sp. B2-3-14]|uniref:hypothetical protein n=1 Tax=Mesorhizobium sp. B2-3-14 TaxID=2589950 RepID=UPI001AEEB717|nr:hypothetical protein [Mesorhizobium sp. B2-3-14]
MRVAKASLRSSVITSRSPPALPRGLQFEKASCGIGPPDRDAKALQEVRVAAARSGDRRGALERGLVVHPTISS